MTIAREVGVRAARTFGFEGEIVEVDLRGGSVLLAIQPDRAEDLGRARSGLGAITDRQLITALWELPHGVAQASDDLPSWVVESVKSAPPGAVERVGGALIRNVRVPVTIVGAVAVGRKLDRLLGRVGQVSAVAPMAVVVGQHIDASEPGILDARLYGVGVAQEVEGEMVTVVDPERVVPTLGPFWWWLSELAYDALKAGITRSSTTP